MEGSGVQGTLDIDGASFTHGSTLTVKYSCGLVVLLSRSRAAIILRTLVTRTSSYGLASSSRAARGAATGGAAAARGAAVVILAATGITTSAGVITWAAAARLGMGGAQSPMAASTSPLTSVPRGPEGMMVAGSRPDSVSSRRTDGHRRVSPHDVSARAPTPVPVSILDTADPAGSCVGLVGLGFRV